MRLLVWVVLIAGVVAVSGQRREQDWWDTIIFYQIYPRSFKDSNGDGIGDLNGITSQLQHLKNIGVGATWLSPIFKSSMYDFGYDIADFYAIHEEYGTMFDFENLLKKAEELDIKIILDFIPNHTSNESEWFYAALRGDNKYYNYFVWEDGKVDENGDLQPPNNWVSIFRKSAWEYRPEVRKYYLHQFLIGQPDLNYRNPDVVEEMKNVMRFWLDKGVAGFRVDAVNFIFETYEDGIYPDEPLSGRRDIGPDEYEYLDHIHTKYLDATYDMIYQFRDVVDEYKAKDGFTRILLSESYASIEKVLRFAIDDSGRHGAHIPFNFALITSVDGNSSAADLKYHTDLFLTYKPLNSNGNWVIGNHDNKRVATRYGVDLVDGLNMLVLLLPGIAVTYNGEEIGMVDGNISWEDTIDPAACRTEDPINYWTVSRDPERTPFQWSARKNAGFSTADKTWLPVADGFKTLNLEAQIAAEKSHYKLYQLLAALRNEDAFKYGRYESVAYNKDVFVFRRWSEDEIYLVVINMRGDSYDIDLTYFENVFRDLEVVASSSNSSKNIGDLLQSSEVNVAARESFVVKHIQTPPN